MAQRKTTYKKTTTIEETLPDGSRPSPLAATLAKSNADQSPHLIITARAGTGKTTTLVEGLKRLVGLQSDLVPSPQQEKIWDEMAKSAGKAKSICFVSFNKSIAIELGKRVPAGCQAMTLHSMGFKVIQQVYGRVKVDEYRIQEILCRLLGKQPKVLRDEAMPLLRGVERLVSLCKMNLAEPTVDNLTQMASYYDIDLGEEAQKVYELVPVVLEKCARISEDLCIDFSDMIWLPVILRLNVPKYDILLVDEAQDLNRCQQALAKLAGKRLILCGDPKQSIYGFAGADSQSMSRMEEELSAQTLPYDLDHTISQGRGCIVLPLTVTRRCGKAIVREANKFVKDFEAFPTNPEGKVSFAKFKAPATPQGTPSEPTYHSLVKDGDFIICRLNAPLVSQCFKFLKMGKKANIQGRDIGQGLISLIKKSKADSVEDFIAYLDGWHHSEMQRELARWNPRESRIQMLDDRKECLLHFTPDVKDTKSMITLIETIFTDSTENGGIRLSSIHKVKGLESRRVFILRGEGTQMRMDKMQEHELEQEKNLQYVAITRAIEELIYVS